MSNVNPKAGDAPRIEAAQSDPEATVTNNTITVPGKFDIAIKFRPNRTFLNSPAMAEYFDAETATFSVPVTIRAPDQVRECMGRPRIATNRSHLPTRTLP